MVEFEDYTTLISADSTRRLGRGVLGLISSLEVGRALRRPARHDNLSRSTVMEAHNFRSRILSSLAVRPLILFRGWLTLCLPWVRTRRSILCLCIFRRCL